jgi:hypothetical protein
MTKLFQEAIEKIKKLSDEDQDIAAELLLTFADANTPQYRLSPEQVEQVKRIQQEIKDGKATFVSDEEMTTFWKFGLSG